MAPFSCGFLHGMITSQLQLLAILKSHCKHMVCNDIWLNSRSMLQEAGEPCVSLQAADFLKMLHEAGARPQHASMSWVENHLQWICWKLAALEAQHSHLRSQLLTADVVFDELKIRQGPLPMDTDNCPSFSIGQAEVDMSHAYFAPGKALEVVTNEAGHDTNLAACCPNGKIHLLGVLWHVARAATFEIIWPYPGTFGCSLCRC